MEPLILQSLLSKLQQVPHLMAATSMSAAASGFGLARAPSHVPATARALHTAGATVGHFLEAHSVGLHAGNRALQASARQQGLPSNRGWLQATSTSCGSAADAEFSRAGRQSFSTTCAAAAVAQVSSSSALLTVQPGQLVEFRRGSEHFLGLVLKLGHKNNWTIEDVTGTVYNVAPKDITCVLPGSKYTQADLETVAQEATTLADPSLLAMAWEFSEPTALYSVQEMAVFIFNDATPANCAAAHRLLRDDRLYFKHAGRSPPIFSPRTPDQVEQLRGQLIAAQKEEESWSRFLTAIATAQKQRRADKPELSEWQGGPHSERIELLRGYAVGDASDQDKFKAIKILNELHEPPTPLAAGEVLQSIGYWPPHLQLSLVTNGITETFRPDIEALARELLTSPPPDPDAETRRDLTHLTVYTVDDESTTEIDDGLSVESLPSGETKLWVHIADPTRYVTPGGALDLEARKRTTSLYLPTGMIPMFPKVLAEGPFSLREGHSCCAVSVGLVLGPDGEVVPDQVEVVPSSIIPTKRLSYDSADEMYDACLPEQEPDLFALLEAAELRKQHREESGGTLFQMPECDVSVDDPQAEAPRVTLTRQDQSLSPSRQMVSEMMIMAGEAMGMLGGKLDVPLPYRGQAEPVLPDAAELEAVPEGPCQAILLRNRMVRSVTFTEGPVRHAGLGLEAYVQFTSPIRRYGDLLSHWQMKAKLRGEAPPFSNDQLSILMDGVLETSQKMTKLEREVESYWTAHYFQQHSKRNPRAVWEAMVLCWFKQDVGLARVLLPHLGLESVVRISTGGRNPGSTFHVRCSYADPRLGTYRLDEVSDGPIYPEDVVGLPEGALEQESDYVQLGG